MCDALSRNTPKLTGIEILLANCIAHGRRQFTEVAESFPDECRYVLESLGAVYGFDAETKEHSLTPEQRLTGIPSVIRSLRRSRLFSIQNIREMSIAAALDARTDWESARLEFLEHERSHFRKS
jgi:hypothetical protein